MNVFASLDLIPGISERSGHVVICSYNLITSQGNRGGADG
jgi:hypothetical protein